MPVNEIGKILGVSHVLEGSVRQSADRLRITVQLVRTATGFHEWAADYDRRPDDLLALQTEVARTARGRSSRHPWGPFPLFTTN